MTTLSAASASIDVPELSDLVHEKTLASARFMKSIRARSQQGYVFVKAVMKPYATFDVSQYVNQITEERNALAQIPNALGYQRIVEVPSGGFLVRQYIFSSVYDRMSTRPFLEEIEKKWLAYQLLSAVRDCHAQNIYHGDIKTENLLVTSWNWLYLTDFSSSFKPTTLPDDNPADFSFYFDTSGRRTCYIAPERFTNPGLGEVNNDLNWAMDMFSVGCAIAEIFLEGPIFSLSQIFKYKSGEYNPEHTHLNKIEDPEVRAMILNMIELDPENRYSAEQHLNFFRSKIFPDYFYSFLHQYMQNLTELSASRQPLILDDGNLVESDEKIEIVYNDFDKISFFLGYGSNNNRQPRRPNVMSPMPRSNKTKIQIGDASLYDGTLLFVTLVVSSLRNTTKASARLKACDLLVSFAERLPDEAKLDRILPYIVGLLNDKSDVVRAAAIHAMTSIFTMVQTVSPINAYIFPEYIFPRLRQFIVNAVGQPSPLIRAAYATCLASLALSSARILDIVQAIRADGRLPALSSNEWAPEASYHGLYDVARAELVPYFEEATVALITDPEPSVRRALLGSVSQLCVFFGSSKASDVILTHLNTYLNDKDWILRCSFYQALVGVASYVGSSSLEKFILPIMTGSLTDAESFVVERVFRSLSGMADLGLFQKSTTWELVSIAVRYLAHPSSWIRESAIQFIVLSTKYISAADKYCIIMPMIQPFLKCTIEDLSEERILDNIKKPLTRTVFEAALHWASRKPNSLFWTAAGRDGAFILSDSEAPQNPLNMTRRFKTRIPPSQRDRDDLTALESLRNLGMTADDETKLMALREYILKLANNGYDESLDDRHRMLNNIISLNQIDVMPQNILFDSKKPVREIKAGSRRDKQKTRQEERHTLADALLDASTTIHDNQIGQVSSDNAAARLGMPTLPVNIRGREFERPSNGTFPDVKITDSERNSTTRDTSTSSRPSPSNTDKLSLRLGSLGSLRHHNSAINLMKRTDSGKAEAEISTTSENAFGRLDGPLHRRSTDTASALGVAVNMADKSRSKSPIAFESKTAKYEPNHSYTGTDPNVLRMLDHHFAENFPVDLYDFGEERPRADAKIPIRRATEIILNQQGGQEALHFHQDPWKPTGQLLTQFSEHTAPINRVSIAPDHVFFVTASDDGSCKIWDTSRLEKNVTPRSRHTHRHAPATKVKALCFVEGTHTFISGADDGSIHAVRIEFKNLDGGETTRYGKPQLVRDYQIPGIQSTQAASSNVEHAVWLHHYRSHTSQSILLIATNKCRIIALDMKTMDIVHVMENPVVHGTPTTFCVDKKHHWLLLGTSHGILDLWDLRFKLRLRSFGIQTDARIDRIVVHPTKGHGRWVMVSAGGEISVWDIEKMTCKEVLRPNSFNSSNSQQAYEAWMPDEETGEKILARFATDMQLNETLIDPILRHQSDRDMNGGESSSSKRPSNPPSTGQPSTTNTTIPGLYILTDYLHNNAQPENPNKSAILFSGGTDRTLRYWDIARPENSLIISGPQTINEDGLKVKVKYELSHPLSLNAGAQIGLVKEHVGDDSLPLPSTTPNAKGTPGSTNTPSKKRTTTLPTTPTRQPSSTSTTPSSARTAQTTDRAKPPRNSVISATQQALLRTHLDGIMDVAVLRKPYGCVVSVDRGGCVYIFH